MKDVRTVIEFGTSKIACAMAEDRDRAGFTVIGYAKAPYAGIRRANWLDSKSVSAAVEDAVEQLERQAGARVRNADISVPACFYSLSCKKVETATRGVVDNRAIDALFSQARDQNMPEDKTILTQYPAWYVAENGEIYADAYGVRAKSVSAGIVTVYADTYFLEDISQLFKNLNIRVDSFIPETQAQALALIPEEKRDVAAVLVDVGYYNTTISLVYADAVLYKKTLEMGGRHIASDIASVMRMDVETAEQLKRRYSFDLKENSNIVYLYAKSKDGRLNKYPYDLLKNIIDARAEQMVAYIFQVVQWIEARAGKKLNIYLTGGGVNYMPGFNSFFKMACDRMPLLCKVGHTQMNAPAMQPMYALLDYALHSDMEYEGVFEPEEKKKGFFSRLSDKLFQ